MSRPILRSLSPGIAKTKSGTQAVSAQKNYYSNCQKLKSKGCYNFAFPTGANFMIDIDKLIQELNAEIEKIRRTVTCLEGLRSTPGSPAASRRGRKSMDAAERQMVSERMKKYWAGRRRQRR
ncbi:MAG: hypothetical protein C5B51_06585 [Terriglobia bacterium]|nr:MAG: hypothetical protein C5B51_06585 [Terriglobia bacterium]